MKKQIVKTISLCLCVCIVSVFLTSTAYSKKDSISKQTERNAQAQTTAAESENISKDETVYVIAGADGQVKKVIVSDWIKNAASKKNINDKSELKDAENVKGNETFVMNGSNMKVWDAEGNDIYYQGNIDKELPVNIALSYKLDGKTISPDQLAGKSGKVTIRFDYKNNMYQEKEINGKKEKIYVPFAMLTGLILDSNNFSNVNVTNGKLINDGDHTAVIGIAFPKMQDNLGLSKDDIDIPDYVEITADVKDFKMTSTMTLATNEVFSNIDTSDAEKAVNDLTSSVNTLGDAFKKLIDGSSELYGGLTTLMEKSNELVKGVNLLYEGAEALKNGTDTLDKNAVLLKDGAEQLYTGLNTLAENNGTLNGGAEQVFNTLLATAKEQLVQSGAEIPDMTIQNYADVLNQLIASLDEDAVYQKVLNMVTQKVEENRPLITAKVTETVKTQFVTPQVIDAVRKQAVEPAVRQQVYNKVAEGVISAATGGRMNKEQYDQAVQNGAIDEKTQKAVETAINNKMESEEIKSTIKSQVDLQMQSKDIQNVINQKVEEQMNSDKVKETIKTTTDKKVEETIAQKMNSDEIKQQLAGIPEKAKKVVALKASLDNYNTFYNGLLTYTNGVYSASKGAESLKNGTNSLKAGTEKLNAGAHQLFDGILQLKNNTPALLSGVKELKNGSMMLSDGLKEVNEKGIKPIVDAVNGDVKELNDRLKAVVSVSKDYNNFSGISDDMDGNVKFIYKTDEIK